MALKRVIAISLLGIYILTATEFHQLLKTSFLIEHYYQHKENNKALTLWNFLGNHYAEQDAQDSEHNNLPFKSPDACMSNILLAVFTHHGFHTSFKTYIVDTGNYSIEQENFLSSSFLASIWQPPKSC